MYSIVENYNTDTECILTNVASSDEFLTYVKEQLNGVEYVTIDNTLVDNILKGKVFIHAKYLINNGNNVLFVEKAKVITKGRVWGEYSRDSITLINNWKLIPDKETFEKNKPVVIQPVIEPVTEPVSEPINELIVEPVTEPIVESNTV